LEKIANNLIEKYDKDKSVGTISENSKEEEEKNFVKSDFDSDHPSTCGSVTEDLSLIDEEQKREMQCRIKALKQSSLSNVIRV
jgi:hypothetical protein